MQDSTTLRGVKKMTLGGRYDTRKGGEYNNGKQVKNLVLHPLYMGNDTWNTTRCCKRIVVDSKGIVVPSIRMGEGYIIPLHTRVKNKVYIMAKGKIVKSFDWAKGLDVTKATTQELKDAYRIIAYRIDTLEMERGEASSKKDKDAVNAKIDALTPIKAKLFKALNAKPEKGPSVRIHERGIKLTKDTFNAMFDSKDKNYTTLLLVEGNWYKMPNDTTVKVEKDGTSKDVKMSLHHYYHDDSKGTTTTTPTPADTKVEEKAA